VLEVEGGERREARAADHHEVGGAPQRDVLAEDAVPDVVEGEAEQGVQTAARHQQTADRGVPVARDADGVRPGLLVRQHARRAARDEQDEEPEQDEVVRGVRQRAGIATVADVQADVPDEAEQRRDDRADEHHDGQRYPCRPLEPGADAVGEVLQPGDLARPVQIADVEQDQADDQADDGHADHFTDGGATALGSLSGEERDVRLQRLHCHFHLSSSTGRRNLTGR
jgi:hypothetical protein